jgi:hypothetical protein
MAGTKLECPTCGLILTTPAPLTGGTVVHCPRCAACFGVPMLQARAAVAAPPVGMARPATAPPVARDVPVPAKPVPTRRTAAPARLKKPAPIEQFRFQDLTAETPSEKTSPQNETKKSEHNSGKKHKRKNDYAPLVWSLAAAGTLIMIGAGIALVMFALKTDDPKTKNANKSNNKVDKQLNTKPPEKKASEVVTDGSEKKLKPANSALKKDKNSSPATNKKPDHDGRSSKDLDESIPIPGLEDPPEKGQKEKMEKPGTTATK